jgi:hypothetical protein
MHWITFGNLIIGYLRLFRIWCLEFRHWCGSVQFFQKPDETADKDSEGTQNKDAKPEAQMVT